MDIDFWHQKWEKNEIGFHMSKANPMLVKYLHKMSLAKGSRIFLPLCGKTLDIAWLLSEGFSVVGAELSEVAIKQLFIELDVEPRISKSGPLKLFSAENIDIFCGDIFELSGESLGKVDAIYDRAALVALPKEMRKQYTAYLLKMTNAAPQLLISFEYDQNLMPGPPFSVSNDEVKLHYHDHYEISLLENMDIPGGLKGKCPAEENVYFLK